eukprot:3004123-Pleurochrysis_carterae.AAC.2
MAPLKLQHYEWGPRPMLDGAREMPRAGCVWPSAPGGNGLDHSYRPLSLRERQLRPCVDGALQVMTLISHT